MAENDIKERFKKYIKSSEDLKQLDYKQILIDYKKALEQSLFHLTVQQRFIGSLLQEMNFNLSFQIPTAGIYFNKKENMFNVIANPLFFVTLTHNERVAVLHHEALHLIHSHLVRFPYSQEKTHKNKKLENMAMDLAINCYISDLPEGAMKIEDWKQKDGTKFPKFRTAEEYLNLLEESEGENKEQLDKYGVGESLDSHNWDELDEADKNKYANELSDILKRTLEKTGLDKNKVPGVGDLIQELEVNLTNFKEKEILRSASKKTFCHSDRMSTWKRRNKRYGFQSPGTKIGTVPKLSIYQDTSGSRSHTELNLDRKIIEKFLKAGAKECKLILWHNEIYKIKKYKLFDRVNENEIESGGTVLDGVIDHINKTEPDLSIILTDGEYFLDSNKKPLYQTIFIIVDNGTVDHALKDVCKTIQLKNLK